MSDNRQEQPAQTPDPLPPKPAASVSPSASPSPAPSEAFSNYDEDASGGSTKQRKKNGGYDTEHEKNVNDAILVIYTKLERIALSFAQLESSVAKKADETAKQLNEKVEKVTKDIAQAQRQLKEVQDEISAYKEQQKRETEEMRHDILDDVRDHTTKSMEVLGVLATMIALVIVYATMGLNFKDPLHAALVVLMGSGGLVFFASIIHIILCKEPNPLVKQLMRWTGCFMLLSFAGSAYLHYEQKEEEAERAACTMPVCPAAASSSTPTSSGSTPSAPMGSSSASSLASSPARA